MDGISIITPTGDRPEALQLLAEYIARQTYTGPLQWVIVDDGHTPFRPQTLPRGEIVYHPRREPGVPGGSLNRNLILGLRLAKHRKIVIMEDDDWYAPSYVDTYAELLDHHSLVGESRARYYNVRDRAWYLPGNTQHASLAQTGFRRELIPLIDDCCRQGTPFIDLHIWKRPVDDKHMIHNHGLCVGIKGMPGRRGLGQGGHQTGSRYTRDPHLVQLRAWVGHDVDRYAPFAASGVKSTVSRSWFDWLADQADTPPWLILGKGPTFARRAEYFPLSRYRTLGLNHTAREVACDVAHIIDLECLDDLGDSLKGTGVLVMPWHPHRGHRPQRETLADLVQRVPVLGHFSQTGRLLHYHLLWAEKFGSRPADEPIVGVKDFSVQAAVNLVIGRGLRGVFTLGVDGGKDRSLEFRDLEPTVAQQVGYCRQFQELTRICRVNRAAIWPLTGDPLPGSHPEAVERLRRWR